MESFVVHCNNNCLELNVIITKDLVDGKFIQLQTNSTEKQGGVLQVFVCAPRHQAVQ